MILHDAGYVVRSANSNTHYFESGAYPAWTRLNAIRGFPDQPPGHGVEPHYHDNDEIWLFTQGAGEVWLDGVCHSWDANSVIYTPMGVVHRYQAFTASEVVAVVTPLERLRRAAHIYPEESGPPLPTSPGFVVRGHENTGPLRARGDRCPLSEFRTIIFAAGERCAVGTADRHEHWLVLAGSIELTVRQVRVELAPGDLAQIQAGTDRAIVSPAGGRVALIGE